MNETILMAAKSYFPKAGADAYYSTLWLKPPTQFAIKAIDALWEIIIDIPLNCQDRGVARTKLYWWQAEFERLLTHAATHPITQLLNDFLPNSSLSAFSEIITGMEILLNTSTITPLLLTEISAKTLGNLLVWRTQLLNENTASLHEPALVLGEYLAYGYFYTHWRFFSERDIFSLGELPDDFIANQVSPKTRELLMSHHNELDLKAKKFELINHVNMPKSNLILFELMKKLLQEIKNEQFNIVTQQIRLTPLRKFWIAWKTQII